MTPTKPAYDASHALVIGINRYSHVSPPLEFAVNDAQAVASELTRLGIDNLTLLIDEQATREAIMGAFLGYAKKDGTGVDDRLVVYFAGHGHTLPSRRREVGYLIPADGDPDNLSTLIRWDDLTRNADLINAKHVLFVMDACYGGLALNRNLKPGASRFLQSMLLRCSRQVLTAGKPDERVADSGGPRPHHSLFTGHFLDAITGAAEVNGAITANGVMAYVYNQVGCDRDSRQTPHYGCLEGDGDFIFRFPEDFDAQIAPTSFSNAMVSIPVTQDSEELDRLSIAETAKRYLSIDESKIKLHDLVTRLTRTVISETTIDKFPLQENSSELKFAERIARYDGIISDLRAVEMLIGRWATESHRQSAILPPQRLAEQIALASGKLGYLSLRWYPVVCLLYSCGLGALASGNYRTLLQVLHAPIIDPDSRRGKRTVLQSSVSDAERLTEVFKLIPGSERLYVPVSEHLFRELQPTADDILFVGGSYESLFDRLEMIFAMECAHLDYDWGLGGRFLWKHSGRYRSDSPFDGFIAEAETDGDQWPLLTSGFFGGSLPKFREIAQRFKERIDRLGWS